MPRTFAEAVENIGGEVFFGYEIKPKKIDDADALEISICEHPPHENRKRVLGAMVCWEDDTPRLIWAGDLSTEEFPALRRHHDRLLHNLSLLMGYEEDSLERMLEDWDVIAPTEHQSTEIEKQALYKRARKWTLYAESLWRQANTLHTYTAPEEE